MKETFRCGGCNALLFKADFGAVTGLIEIKCRRCRQINLMRPLSPSLSALRDAIHGEVDAS